ncbi:MAG: hypothetical protein FJX47_18310, partial [Alphaproteobacteria bacterium]|nr:hypothetical protein [Alphaproteobacteria bacterium]
MRFTLARSARFDDLARSVEARARRAVSGSVAEITEELKQRLRLHTVGAGLGARLARTWQNKLYGM